MFSKEFEGLSDFNPSVMWLSESSMVTSPCKHRVRKRIVALRRIGNRVYGGTEIASERGSTDFAQRTGRKQN